MDHEVRALSDSGHTAGGHSLDARTELLHSLLHSAADGVRARVCECLHHGDVVTELDSRRDRPPALEGRAGEGEIGQPGLRDLLVVSELCEVVEIFLFDGCEGGGSGVCGILLSYLVFVEQLTG